MLGHSLFGPESNFVIPGFEAELGPDFSHAFPLIVTTSASPEIIPSGRSVKRLMPLTTERVISFLVTGSTAQRIGANLGPRLIVLLAVDCNPIHHLCFNLFMPKVFWNVVHAMPQRLDCEVR